jgi:hypothetical protein
MLVEGQFLMAPVCNSYGTLTFDNWLEAVADTIPRACPQS